MAAYHASEFALAVGMMVAVNVGVPVGYSLEVRERDERGGPVAAVDLSEVRGRRRAARIENGVRDRGRGVEVTVLVRSIPSGSF
jgi:hypothetical protein